MNRYCGCIDTDCSECYEIEAPYCFDFVALPSIPGVYADLYIWVRDKFGNLYYADLTASHGIYYLIASDFSKEIFSSDFGCVTVFVTSDANGQTIVPFTVGYTEYNCISLCTSPPVFLVDECENFITDEDGNYIIIP